ncbi:MAG: SMP-30/gluconolactonase/LRE family protein [Caulobacteraceae bacterium]
MRKVELALDAKAALGECPRWHVGEGVLYFVDITARTLTRFDPATGAWASRSFEQPVGCFAFRRAGGFVLGMKDGFALLDAFDGEPRPFGAQVEAARAQVRFNDGRADAVGRFWAGTMDGTKIQGDGALYRLDPDGSVTRMAEGALTSNGVAFSPDGQTLYYSDTPAHRITAYDFDLAAGAIARPRTFHAFPYGNGRPDGATVDVEGAYWCALYAGGRVVRLSVQGEIVEEVEIPAPNVTMIGFGGADLRTAYVTTARQNASPEDLERFPHAGGLFTFRVDVPGLVERPFGG